MSPKGLIEDVREVMREREAARFVGISERTLRDYRKRGTPLFPFVAAGDVTLYSRTAILATLAAGAQRKCGPGRPRKTATKGA